MIKDIKYNGFTETPSDYACPDGDLATVIGLAHEDEGLQPIQPAVPWFTLPTDYSVALIHRNTTGYVHYIIQYGLSFYWIDEPTRGTVFTVSDFTDTNLLITLTGQTYYSGNTIGNSLILLASDGTHYFLWDAENVTYKSMGTHIPEIEMYFALKSEVTKFDLVTFDAGTESGGEMEEFESDSPERAEYTNEVFIDALTNKIMAALNKRIAEIHKEGRFVFPFMVRYAYRLYDETLSMHSVPILMVTDTHGPHCFMGGQYAKSQVGSVDARNLMYMISTLDCDLYYKLLTNVQQTLADWTDIVKSVDIFISAPIYTYDQSAKVVGQTLKDNDENGYSISMVSTSSYYQKFYTAETRITQKGGDYDGPSYGDLQHPSTYGDAIYLGHKFGDVWTFDVYGKLELDLKRFTEAEMIEKIRSCNAFYLLKSIPIDDLVYNTRTKIDVDENYLTTLVNREVMTDDYDSHAQLIPRYSFTYNSRLTLANITKRLPSAPAWITSIPYNNYNTTASGGGDEGTAYYEVFVYLKINGRTVVVKDTRNLTDALAADNTILYYYYPDSNAYKAVVHKHYYDSSAGYKDTYYVLSLSRHDFLNGAVFFSGWKPTIPTTTEVPVVSSADERIVNQPNKTYTSEVGNPYLFMASGINTIGVSDILGIRPAVKTMSPSQFGQFKFYVFAGDGVWALEVSSSGYLEKPSLVTPDIVLGDGKSITQIDGAVLFASARGIMMLSGSTCTCVSDILTSSNPFMPFGASADKDLLPKLRNVIGDALTNISDMVPFLTFIQDCQMLYDYTHQRIIVYSPSRSYAYVFSLKSKLWSMMPSDIKGTVNYFPNALALASDGCVENYSEDADTDELTAVSGTIITRPLKLEPTDALKSITSIIQRGQFRKGHVQTILYGSRDLFNWQLVWSSSDHYLRGFSGTPYKYFRIALICSMAADESIFGCDIDYIPRYTNRLR